MNKIINSILLVSISVVFGLIIFGGNFNPFETISNTYYESPSTVETYVSPTETSVVLEKYTLHPQTTVVTPSVVETKKIIANHNFVPNLTQKAFGIPSGQNSVTFTEWPTGMLDPIFLAIDSNDDVYFPEFSSNSIGKLDPQTNQITRWTIPTTNSVPISVAVNSADRVFFTERDTNKIGMLDPIGNTITEWTVPTANSRPFGIVVDKNDLVYFTELSGSKIGRLDLVTNEITEWNIISGLLQHITVDFNNNVYFSRISSNKIVKLNPSSDEITEWTLPTPHRGPYDITLNPTADSPDIFFGATSANTVGRLVQSTNIITEWVAPTLSSIQEMAQDSAGNIYFVETAGGNDNIARLVPSTNTITEWDPPTSSSIEGIAVNSIGEVFFSEFGADKIGRLN